MADTAVNTNTAAAEQQAQTTSVVKTHKHPFKVRQQKAMASTKCRKRAAFFAKNPNAVEADLPLELQKVDGPRIGKRTIDTSEMDEKELQELEALRISKAIASRECIARKKWLTDNPDKTAADLPEHLQKRKRAKKAASTDVVEAAVEAEVVAEVAAEEAVAEVKPKRKYRPLTPAKKESKKK